MASLYPIASVPETRAAEPTRVSGDATQGPIAQAAAKLRAEQEARRHDEMLPTNLKLRLDADAGWFVQTVTNSVTDEIVRRYPSEQQLAFSRAVMAYLRAQIGS